jgi:selT/selW/selH-like putative selenoprotein
VQVELIEGSGGAFEIRDGKSLIFSKLQEGRFPETDEILRKLKS